MGRCEYELQRGLFGAVGGRVVYLGVTSGEVQFSPSPIFHRRELTLFASRNATPEDFQGVLKGMTDGSIDTDRWVTHRMALAEVPEQFAKVISPEARAIKAIIDIQG